ncbi:SAM-dependent methyltransferase [Sphingomonas sp. BIUV-7]|uniref:SAM-dependent methyltransferase n=1 Tax=Sphingomonas natans TaxID=3063330 RepID=A0ABT8YG40_9SPHN|nr:SAM-dependent methyltransferase [Sphingomonas sp. BIUV-7]MDO6416849.1 SAM-dependent methyltransferase [Sphingomonas sp. BIUV-7]
MIAMRPVGRVVGGRASLDDDGWDAVQARIELAQDVPDDALAGLADFSHVEIVYHFDRVAEAAIVTGARHPRGRADWPKVGIFAQRGKARPNRIGVTVCRLIAVEPRALIVAGLDAIEGTPVLDIKPVLSGFLPREPIHEPEWARAIMRDYW